MAGRGAAVAPGSADTLAAFVGVYQTHQLPDCAGKPSDAGFELAISVDAAGTCFCLLANAVRQECVW